MANGFIYKITSPSNRIYIGQTIDIYSRWMSYFSIKKSRQVRLIRSLLKYGSNNHVFEIIEECSIDKLNERERHWQEHYNVLGKKGLNCVLTSTKDKKMLFSDDTRKRMSDAHKGKTIPNHVKEKMSKAHLGRKKNPESIIKAIETKKKNPLRHTDESKKKISETFKLRYSLGMYKRSTSIKKRHVYKNRYQKYIFDPNTGVYYYTVKEAAEYLGIKRTTLNAMLSGQNPNNTGYIYI